MMCFLWSLICAKITTFAVSYLRILPSLLVHPLSATHNPHTAFAVSFYLRILPSASIHRWFRTSTFKPSVVRFASTSTFSPSVHRWFRTSAFKPSVVRFASTSTRNPHTTFTISFYLCILPSASVHGPPLNPTLYRTHRAKSRKRTGKCGLRTAESG